jgi:hypothetical protein
LKSDSWQVVAKFNDQQTASIAEAILHDNDIVSVVIPKQDSSLHLFGSFELMVKDEDLSAANALLIDLIP